MANLDLKRLKAYGDTFIHKLIRNNNANSTQFMQILIELSKENIATINIQDYEYYKPENIRFLDVKPNNNLDTFSVSFYGTVMSENGFEIPYIDSSSSSKKFESKPNKKFGVITHIEVSYKSLSEDEIDIISVDLISNFFKTESDALSEWKTTKERINQSKIVASVSPYSKLLEKIDAIEIAEDLMNSMGEEIEEDLFLEKVIMLQKVANTKHPKRVAYEYGSVADITNQPVLMNKSLSIFLTKEQVLGLVQDLSQRYKDIILNIRAYNVHNMFKSNNNVVPVVFGKTERGHADSYNFKIVLPKLGDWRTGYRDLYTAELVFHEFAHILDSDRKKTIRGKATFDVHRHDFVNIFEKILLDYKDYINEKYSIQMFREMILNLDDWMSEFKISYENRIKSIKLQEKNRRDSLEESKRQDLDLVGISENSYPLEIILNDYRNEKLKFLLFSLDRTLHKNIPDYRKSNVLKARIKVLDALDGIEEQLIFNKDEITEIKNSIIESDINSWISEQPYEEQIKLLNPIKDFKDKVKDLADNRLKLSEKPKDVLVIEDYDIDPMQDYLDELNS